MPPTATDWPAPPFTYYLFENPWPAAICLITLAAAFALIAYRTARRWPRIAAIATAALALALLALARLITTDREIMLHRTDEMVRAAVIPVQLDLFRKTLSKDVRLFDRDYAGILNGIETGLDRWHVRQAWITNLLVDQADAARGRTYLAVVTRLDTNIGGGSTLTRWLLHWKKESDGQWRVVKIEWLTLGDQPARPGDLP